jgi:hypothetical protein
MNAHAPIEQSLEDAVAERAARRAERIEMLARMGMRMAQALEARVFDAPEPMADPQAAVEVFAKLSRAMRLTEALGARLDRDLLKAEAQDATPAGPAPMTAETRRVHEDKMDALCWQLTLRARGGVRRDAVREMVEQAIECDARRTGREQDIERLAFDLDDRLKGIDSDAGWLNQPLGAVAKWLCGQMGVPFDPSLWEEGGPNGPDDFWEMGGAELSGRRVGPRSFTAAAEDRSMIDESLLNDDDWMRVDWNADVSDDDEPP